ncbi:hypothetical protein IP91_00083 [Pseudoduganella lurida]|uniref:Uncharacterized protein n=1 Tax=Pseudoduganella lurida TaxID=1036180 RepID=A0A562RIW7_9BURK|nr:hypothetical protein [Pseudoduganella lurida]TWI69018.1 hypothetical protein IP91_00083 [Pseudoduganella lurida]
MLKKFKDAFKPEARWLIICVISLTMLAAFPIIAQRLGEKLYEPVATLWGSALGALAGVAGAFWIADRQTSVQRRGAARLVREMFFPVTHAISEVVGVLGRPERPNCYDGDDEPQIFEPEKWREVADQAGFVVARYTVFRGRIHRYEAGLSLLSANALTAAFELETQLEDAINGSISRLLIVPHEYSRGEHVPIAKSPSWSVRFILSKIERDIQLLMAKLEAEAM